MYKLLSLASTNYQKEILSSLVSDFMYDKLLSPSSLSDELLIIIYRLLEKDIINFKQINTPTGDEPENGGSILKYIFKHFVFQSDIKTYLHKLLNKITELLEKDDKCKKLSYNPERIEELVKKRMRKLSYSNTKDSNDIRDKYFLLLQEQDGSTRLTTRSKTTESYSNSNNMFRMYIDLTKSELTTISKTQTDDNMKNYIMRQIHYMKNDDSCYSNSKIMEKLYESKDAIHSLEFYHSNVNVCMNIIKDFLDEIVNNIQTMPLIIRYICKIISLLLLRNYPNFNILKVNNYIAQFLLLIFKPIFSDPEKKGILPSKYLSPSTKASLVELEKILTQLMSGSFFKTKDNYNYTPFNYYFIDLMPKVLTFFQTITDVKLPKVLTKLIDGQKTNPKIFEQFIYDHFKENPNEEINNISICFNLEQIITMIEIIQKNEKILVPDKYNCPLPNEYNSYKKSYQLLKTPSKLNEFKAMIEKDKKDNTISYSVIEYNIFNEKMEIISKLATRHFILKEISCPKTKEEQQKNIVIKVKNALSQILYNSYIIPEDDFFGFIVNDTDDFINALNSFKQIDLYNFDNSIQTQWYIISLKSLISKLPEQYKKNDYSKLYNELTQDLKLSTTQMDYDTISKAIDYFRYAHKKYNKINQSLNDIEKLQSHLKVEDFIYNQQIEIFMKIGKLTKGNSILYVEPRETSLTEKLEYLNCKVVTDPTSLCKDIHTFIQKFPNINESHFDGNILEKENKLEIPTAVKNYLNILRSSIKSYGINAFTQIDYKNFQESEFIRQASFTKHNNKQIDNQTKQKYEERFFNQITNHIMDKLYHKLYPQNVMDKDLIIHQRCLSLQWIELKHLTTITNIDLETFLPSTIGYIEQIDKVKNPRDKIEQIVKVIQIINDTLKFSYGDKIEVGLDVELPFLFFIIIKSSPKRLASNIRYIELFHDDLSGLIHHKLTTAKIIGERLCNFDFKYLINISETDYNR